MTIFELRAKQLSLTRKGLYSVKLTIGQASVGELLGKWEGFRDDALVSPRSCNDFPLFYTVRYSVAPHDPWGRDCWWRGLTPVFDIPSYGTLENCELMIHFPQRNTFDSILMTLPVQVEVDTINWCGEYGEPWIDVVQVDGGPPTRW